MKNLALKIAGLALVAVGMTTVLSAVPVGPEIDAATGANALALLGVALLIIRGRKR